MPSQAPPDGLPLADVTVVEFAGDTAARYCGRLFAAFGARVVRIAEPAGEPVPKSIAAFQAWLDQRKIVAASFDAACKALPGTPDVFIVGDTPDEVRQADGLIADRGLESLRLGMTWFGMEGPYAGWLGDDALIQSLIGIVSGFGPVEGPPVIPQGRAPQIIAGATLFMAGMATLWGRRRGRADRHVDVDVLEAALCFTEVGPPGFEKMGGKSTRTPVNRFGANHPMSVYPTADGWIGVTALTPAQWTALCRLIGRPEWADDPCFLTSVDRVARADEIDETLRKVFPTRSSDWWLIEGQKARIPMAPVPRPIELLTTPHWVGRRGFAPFTDDPNLLGPRLPFRMAFDGHRRPVPDVAGDAPLSGLRVIDFSMGWAGPLCTRSLADLGADVVKVESHTHYDWWRGWEPPGASDPPAYELKTVFNVMNRGKRGVALDLTTPEGQARAKQLVAGADMVIENYAPGVMDKLGLGHEVLQAVRPGLVMVSMGAFGAEGPWSFFRAYGATVEQASGMAHVNGHADWPPSLQHGAYGDPVAGIYGAVAAMAALAGRARLGGAWVDLAQVECLFQLGAEAIIAAQIDGDAPRLGSRSPYAAPRCVVTTADPDEPLAVVATTELQWRNLCGVLGRPDWASDPALASVGGRNSRGDEIEAALAKWAEDREPEDAAASLQAAGVPAAPVVPSHRLASHVQLAAQGAWTSIERRHVGRHLMAAPPYRVGGTRPAITRPAPLLGEHSAEVLEEIGAALP
jgi:crotonobetainyl-CoA:carnitine CoA-transferase CaiB-like acyl-CoA transferase